MSAANQIGIAISAVSLIITLIFLHFSEQNIKTIGQLMQYVSNIQIVSLTIFVSVIFFVSLFTFLITKSLK